MDDNSKNTCSYQVDQDLLDARGINMTVDEVAGLSTGKYSERVQSLKLSNEDLAFLKGLRRRIKNRLASQNSRRRSVEHLRRLTRELRAVRACRRDALAERRALVLTRDKVRDKCSALRRHLVQILKERSDATAVPSIEIESQPPKDIDKSDDTDKLIGRFPEHISVIVKNDIDREQLQEELEKEEDIYERVRKELQKEREIKETIIINDVVRDTIVIKNEETDFDDVTIEENFNRQGYDFGQDFGYDQGREDFDNSDDYERRNFDKYDIRSELSNDKDIFECKIGKLVTQSVNHMFNDKKKVFAKTVFISNDKLSTDIKSMVIREGQQDNGVLNLSVKEGRRKSHGRKQSAPRRIAYYSNSDDGVLDLKIKKEPQ